MASTGFDIPIHDGVSRKYYGAMNCVGPLLMIVARVVSHLGNNSQHPSRINVFC